MGKSPDLNDPKTLNEKIVWLKLNDRTPLHTKCADKFAVREYINEKVGDKYLVPLYYHTVNPKDIVPNNLPSPPYIIKTNHDSGGGVFVYDTEQIDWNQVQKSLKKRLSHNYYWESKEWQYKNIKPRIIVEKLLQNKEGKIPFDYKLHCFNGKVITIQVDMNRGTDHHFRNWYDVNWKREPFKWAAVKDGKKTEPSDYDIKRPSTLEEMIRLSELLAAPFCYVRVDWYDVDGQLYFGELTFHHDGGNSPIEPSEWDLKLGEKLNLIKH
ncbi:ATP-grasp fold amidoligase family protein [Flagellimonas profundi]|uniref:Glycosyl transferase n=1 Tax=Flagellimonas profundi TaxID=2915620 RepID=A0ABS3FBK2_9FLAO|nr:ATP-grasp fold amidoligase family protein [Allomuricauda profundi]MBO0340529.1 glycosyl transferase [Allomuricauda profundi]